MFSKIHLEGSIQYKPEIDGLRALAVLPVLLFHADLGCPGGFVGVDVFFVISGFLIGRILFAKLDRNEFSFGEFWERRLRRILPTLFVMTLATIVVGFFVLMPLDMKSVGVSAAMQTLAASNLFFYLKSGYFDNQSQYNPLLHTWSLAVEEQFYLLLPVLLYLFRRISRKSLLVCLWCLALGSFAFCLYSMSYDTNAAFYLLPSRAWELLSGVLLAKHADFFAFSKSVRDRLSVLGLGAILLPAFFYTERTPFPGITALPPVAGTVALIASTFTAETSFVGRVLSTLPLRLVGLMSYSLYLWHWPVIVYLKYTSDSFSAWLACVALALTFFISYISWHLIEQPFRNRSLIGSRSVVFTASIIATLTTFAIGSLVHFKQGFPQRFEFDISPLMVDADWTGVEYSLNPSEELQSSGLPAVGLNTRFSQPIDFIVWGDSHALMLSKVFDDVAKELGLSGRVLAYPGVSPLAIRKSELIGEWLIPEGYPKSAHEVILELRPKYLFVVGRWNEVFRNLESLRGIGEVGSTDSGRGPNDLWTKDDCKIWEEYQSLIQFREFLRACKSAEIKTIVVKQVPETGQSTTAKDYLLWRVGRRRRPPNKSLTREKYYNQTEVFNSFFGCIEPGLVSVLDASDLFFDSSGKTINYRDGRAFYYDDDHLTQWGAYQIRPQLICVINRLSAAASTEDVTK